MTGESGHGSGASAPPKGSQVIDPPPFHDTGLFDEAGYLRLYPAIAEALMRGLIDTPWAHFENHGRAEGRRPNDVDPDFYLAAYPAVEEDFGRPPAQADAAAHYLTVGRARGYLPNAAAPRPANGAAFPSPSGGFWIDQANAPDLVRGRLDLGRISRPDAALLRAFARDGIVPLDRPFERDQANAADLIVEQIFTGLYPNLLFACPALGVEPLPWRPELIPHPAAALDPHMVSRAIRDVLLDKAVTDFLALLFDARPRLIASQAFLRQTAAADRDVASVAVSLPSQFVAVTFALEETDAGDVLIWPGSHRLPDLPFPGGALSLAEARRTGAHGLEDAIAARPARIGALTRHHPPLPIAASPRGRMVRHAHLIHAAVAPEPPWQRRSLTAWYCPSHVLPCHGEAIPAGTHIRNGVLFSSGVYPAADPRD